MEVRFFPANAMDLVQTADSFVIQKVKTAWKVSNPRKAYFLRLAADVLKKANMQMDKEGLLYHW